MSEEGKLLTHDDLTEEMIISILPKIIKMYERAKDGEVSN